MKQIWIALLLVASGGSANAQDKPNVVVILSDNVGYGDIGAYVTRRDSRDANPTPRPARQQRLRLTQFFVEQDAPHPARR